MKLLPFARRSFLLGLLIAAPVSAAQDPAPIPSPAPAPVQGPAPAPSDHPSIAIPGDGTPPSTSPSGLITSVLRAGDGSGRRPQHGDQVEVRFSGFLLDGTLIDGSGEQNSIFRVGQVVEGWNEALKAMEPGQRNKVTLLPELGYGEKGRGTQIPPNAALIFDIELIDFKAGPTLPTFRPLPETTEVLEGGVRCLVEAPGQGAPPKDDEPYKLGFTFFNIRGQPIDSSAWGTGPLLADKLRVQFPFLKQLHDRLKPGARLWVEVPAAQGFGDIELPTVKPGEPSIWALEVLAVLANPVLPEYRPIDRSKLTMHPSGLAYEVLEAGSGPACGPEGMFKLHYTIYAPSGEVIDASRKRGSSTLVGSMAQMRLPMLQTLPPLMPVGAIYLCELPASEIFGQRTPPGVEPSSICGWRLEMAAILAPLPVPEFKRTAEGAGEKTPNGLLVEWIQRGSGPNLRPDQSAVVQYAGWLEDGTLFDSSYQRGDVDTLQVERLMPGWTEGLQLMNKGSIARLTMPPELAFGDAGQGAIPPGATVIFLIELVDIQE